MKRLIAIGRAAIVVAVLFFLGCGGSTPAPQKAPPIDPSGNWSMTLSDSGGNSLLLSALLSQNGSVVTA